MCQGASIPVLLVATGRDINELPVLSGMPQTSAFGALLDVVVDNVTRALLWVDSGLGPLAALPPVLEMFTFACTHKARPAVMCAPQLCAEAQYNCRPVQSGIPERQEQQVAVPVVHC